MSGNARDGRAADTIKKLALWTFDILHSVLLANAVIVDGKALLGHMGPGLVACSGKGCLSCWILTRLYFQALNLSVLWWIELNHGYLSYCFIA